MWYKSNIMHTSTSEKKAKHGRSTCMHANDILVANHSLSSTLHMLRPIFINYPLSYLLGRCLNPNNA
nr:hypothetical protein Itr_chr08CG05730 [Ipomoea trifida]